MTTTPLGGTGPGGDPLAVAAGNASLLGIGYLLLRRRLLATATGVVTVLLLVLVLTTASVVAEILVVLWWAAMIVHGWRLAGGRRPSVRDRRARWIGIVPAVVVLLAFGLLRFDAGVSAASVDDARLRGDCPQAVSTQDGVWFGPRLANAPAAGRGDDTTAVCAQLGSAQQDFDQVFAGDVAALQPAYEKLSGVLTRYPGHERMVGVTVDGFVTRLPVRPVCTMAAVTDDLGKRPAAAPPIDGLRTAAVRLRPAAVVGCGDTLLGGGDWDAAQARYQQLLTEFPRDALVARARKGVDAAVAGRERDQARARLPQFCGTPFGYRGAPVPGPGLNRVLLPGATPDIGQLPVEWRARDVTQGALVICAGNRERGSVARSCPYVQESSGRRADVAYHRIAVPVRVFEFRTGRIVLDTRVEIDGASCPPRIFGPDAGPGDQDVAVSDADVDNALRGALSPLVVR